MKGHVKDHSLHDLRKYTENHENPQIAYQYGLLHHMDDDQALETIDYARSLLSSTGRFVCTEPTFLAHQSYVSRLVMGWDRGKNIRSETEWKKLFQKKFRNIDTNIFFGVSSFQYIRIVVVMTKSDIGEL